MNQELAALFLGRALIVLCSVVSVRLYTQTLGPQEVGVMSLILSAVNLFTLLVGSISLFFYRQVLEWHARDRLFLNIWRYFVFLVGAAIAACVLVAPAHWFGDPAWRSVAFSWLLLLVGGNVVFASLNGALLYVLNARGHRVVYAVLSNLTSWAGLAMALGLVFYHRANAELWLAGLLVGQMLSCVLAVGRVLRLDSTMAATQDSTPDFALRVVWAFSWPLVICTALYWAQRSSYGPMMAAVNDVATLGLFSVAFSIGMLAVSSFDALFKDYYSPVYYRAITNGSEEVKIAEWNAYMGAFVPAIFVVFVFMASLGNSVLEVLVSGEFRGLGTVVGWGALAQALISLYSMYVLLASTFMDNKVLLVPNLVGAALTIGGLALLLPYDPFFGAGLSVSVGILATTLLTARRLRKRYAVAFPAGRAFRGVVMAAPLWVVMLLDRTILPEASVGNGAALILVAASYVFIVQRALAQPWVHRAQGLRQ